MWNSCLDLFHFVWKCYVLIFIECKNLLGAELNGVS